MGRPIWAYEIQGDRYGKRLVPTDLCRAYWPQVLTWIAEGDSLRKVAAAVRQRPPPCSSP